MKKIGHYPYSILSFHTDARGQASMAALCEIFQDAAGLHARERAFGFDDLRANSLAWVLTRFLVRVRRYPRWMEPVTVETWVDSLESLFSVRKFNLLDPQGLILASASSTWALLSLETRRPVPLAQFVDGTPYVTQRECLAEAPMKIHPAEQYQTAYATQVRMGDIDMNGHLNNIRFMAWALDAFPSQRFRQGHLASLEVNFLAECFEGDPLDVQTAEQADPGASLVRLLRTSDQKTTALLRLRFETPAD